MEHMQNHYVKFMGGAIALREYEQVQELVVRHREIGYPAAYVDFFEGEMYRLRDGEGDRMLAINAYQSAIKASATLVPVTAYRGLAYLYLKEKNKESAKYYFQQYIKLQPEANDKEMILFHLDSLEGI